MQDVLYIILASGQHNVLLQSFHVKEVINLKINVLANEVCLQQLLFL